VPAARDYYPECPEPFLVSLARTGDRDAFAEIVRRRQSAIRNLMRRCCNDHALADDLTQQVFFKLWLNIRKLRNASAFSAWLRRLAINVWLHHARRNDVLRGAGEMSGRERAPNDPTGLDRDLDRALAKLDPQVRLCVVLNYSEGLSHREVAELTGMPLGTVKSHIRTGARQLQRSLSAYETSSRESSA
jgi:RNA polymerase sigma-70 factor (ECF subfamily)